MLNTQVRKYPCSCCGREAKLEKGNKEREGITCLRCHMEELRKTVKQIHEGIALLMKSLNETNQCKFKQMDSQTKKLMYFQALEDGLIKFEIK
jgi:DNA-directed RNA polymerase subunit RPC12/RpoP